MPHLISTIEELKGHGVGFRSISDGVVDTTSPSGQLVFNIFSALAQFERRLIQERTMAGLEAARARGRKGGRKPLAADEGSKPGSCEKSKQRIFAAPLLFVV